MYLVISLIYYVKGFKKQVTKVFWMIMGKTHLNFGNDKNQVTFYLRGSFGSATSSSVSFIH